MPPVESLTLQENMLAAAMAHHIGDATLRYTVVRGDRYHDVPDIGGQEFDRLAEDFRDDPKEALAYARESLIAINRDQNLHPSEKERRLDRYLDAYTSLTIKLDHKAFPPTQPGKVEKGVPEYLADGFVDMGGDSRLNPAHRSREMIKVDKEEIFKTYKPVLKELFSADFGQGGTSEQKQRMLSFLAAKVYSHVAYDRMFSKQGVVNLSELSEGVCRHQAMVFQVLAQAAGLKTRLLKTDVSFDNRPPERHAANLARVNSKWYIIDPTNPDYTLENGKPHWRVGAMRISAPPPSGGNQTYRGTMKYSGQERTYDAHDDMYWHISR